MNNILSTILKFIKQYKKLFVSIATIIIVCIVSFICLVLYKDYEFEKMHQQEEKLRIEQERQDSIDVAKLVGYWERVPSGSILDDEEETIHYLIFDKYSMVKCIRNNDYYKDHTFSYSDKNLMFDNQIYNPDKCILYEENGIKYLRIEGKRNTMGLYKKINIKPEGKYKLN